MSALDDYADVIKVIRKTDLRPEPETFGEAMRHAILALADELESLQPDAALGALVRQMPDDHGLAHEGGWHMMDFEAQEILGAFHDTPEAALREALEEQDDNPE